MEERNEVSRELHEQTADMQRSAKAVARSTGELTDSADRRTDLAGDRTLFAAERTYAAWMRTALAALASGVGARALAKGILPTWIGEVSGTILILFAAICIVAAIWRELSGISGIQHPDVRPIPNWILVPFNLPYCWSSARRWWGSGPTEKSPQALS